MLLLRPSHRNVQARDVPMKVLKGILHLYTISAKWVPLEKFTIDQWASKRHGGLASRRISESSMMSGPRKTPASPENREKSRAQTHAQPVFSQAAYDAWDERRKQDRYSVTTNDEWSVLSDSDETTVWPSSDDSSTLVDSPTDSPAFTKPRVLRARSQWSSRALNNVPGYDDHPPVDPVPEFARERTPQRTVRWKEGLITSPPTPPSEKRQGWYNRRGDQLWTNDGEFRPAPPGREYPPDLAKYPDRGQGWMNEHGHRIDMRHRPIPKPPLRSAMKKAT